MSSSAQRLPESRAQEPHCRSCGRPMAPRRRWRSAEQPASYCSRACRARRVNPTDRALEAAILELLAARSPGATLCPGEAARRVAGEEAWRELMEPARRAARRLSLGGIIDIVQRGTVVAPGEFRGPIRLRMTMQ